MPALGETAQSLLQTYGIELTTDEMCEQCEARAKCVKSLHRRYQELVGGVGKTQSQAEETDISNWARLLVRMQFVQ